MAFKRLLAAIIDLLFCIFIFTIIILIVFNIYSINGINVNFNDPIMFDMSFYTMMIIAILIFSLYFFCCDYFFKGRSIGKAKMNIVVKNNDGSNLGLSKAILRTLLKLVSIFIYPVFILIFFNKNCKTFYDFIVQTQIYFFNSEVK